jgi:Tfp pilus assembly protein PilF
VWDDPVVVNKQLVFYKSIGDVLFPPDGIPQHGDTYYRPVVTFSYLMDNCFFSTDDPTGRHATNIVLHALITFLVWLFALQCLKRFPNGLWGAIIAASIFAVHPIHTESVSWITGRSDPLAALFVMASLVVAQRYGETKKTGLMLSSAVLYFLALLSKEVSLSALLVLPFVLYLTPLRSGMDNEKTVTDSRSKNRKNKKNKPSAHAHKNFGQFFREALPLFVLFIIATAVYFVLRHQAHIVGHGASLGIGFDGLFVRGWRVMAYYALKLVVPPPQLHFVTLNSLPSLLASSLILLVTAAAIVAGTLKWKRHSNLLWFTVVWIGCTLAPSLSVALFNISETPVAERYLFLPSVGFSLLLGGIVALGLEKPGTKKLLMGAMVLGIGLYGAGTIHRNLVWVDNVRLWSDATQKSPDQGLPWNQLGTAYNTRKDLEKASTCFENAISADYDREGRSIAHNNLGMIYLKKEDIETAESHFHASIREREAYATPYYGLGLATMRRIKKGVSLDAASKYAEDAIDSFKEAISLNPRYVKAFWGLVRAYAAAGNVAKQRGQSDLASRQYNSAIQTFDELTRMSPQFYENHPEYEAYVDSLKKNL